MPSWLLMKHLVIEFLGGGQFLLPVEVVDLKCLCDLFGAIAQGTGGSSCLMVEFLVRISGLNKSFFFRRCGAGRMCCMAQPCSVFSSGLNSILSCLRAAHDNPWK